jgi:hypothetical protein
VRRGSGTFQSFSYGRVNPSTSISDRVSISDNMKTINGVSHGQSAPLDDKQCLQEIQDEGMVWGCMVEWYELGDELDHEVSKGF